MNTAQVDLFISSNEDFRVRYHDSSGVTTLHLDSRYRVHLLEPELLGETIRQLLIAKQQWEDAVKPENKDQVGELTF